MAELSEHLRKTFAAQKKDEKIIRKSFLLCYHYRIISEEHALNKIKTNNWYIENNYSLKDLVNNQSKDIIDYTLKNKIN